MNLLQELRRSIGQYLAGDLDLMALSAWLGDHIQAVEDSGSHDLVELNDRVWFLIDDFLAEERNEDEVRTELTAALLPPATVVPIRVETASSPGTPREIKAASPQSCALGDQSNVSAPRAVR